MLAARTLRLRTLVPVLTMTLLWAALSGCKTSPLMVEEPVIILGREVAKSNGVSIASDTGSSFSVGDVMNIELRTKEPFREPQFMMKIYRTVDENGTQLGSEYLTRSMPLSGLDPKGKQLLINNTAKARSVGSFISSQLGEYRLEIHAQSYLIASKSFRLTPNK